MGGSQGGKACGGGEGRWWCGVLVNSAPAPGVHGRPRLPLKWEVSRVSASGVCAPARPCARLPCARLSLSSRMFPRCHSAALCSHTRAPPRLPLSAAPSVPPTPPPCAIDPAALAPGGGSGRRLLPPVHCCRVLLGTRVLLGIGLCRCLIPPGIPGGAGWTAHTTDSRGLFLPKVSAECSAGVRGGGGRCGSWAWGPSPSLLGSVPAGTAAMPPTWGQWLGLGRDSGPDIWAAEGHREL